MHVANEKLVMTGAAPSEKIRNKVWNQIKAVDPIFADLQCEIAIDSSLPEPIRTYTVVAGDSCGASLRTTTATGRCTRRSLPPTLEN